MRNCAQPNGLPSFQLPSDRTPCAAMSIALALEFMLAQGALGAFLCRLQGFFFARVHAHGNVGLGDLRLAREAHEDLGFV